MGNEEMCCPEHGHLETANMEIKIRRSTISPIINGRRQLSTLTNEIQPYFDGDIVLNGTRNKKSSLITPGYLPESQKSGIRDSKSSFHMESKLPEQDKPQKLSHENNFYDQTNPESKIKIKMDKNGEKSMMRVSESQILEINQSRQNLLGKDESKFRFNPELAEENQVDEDEILIKFLPNVNRLISHLKPFQKELAKISSSEQVKLIINRDVYKGQVNQANVPHGYGMLVKENGNILLSKFFNGNANGQAYVIFNDGSYYHGQVKDNLANDQNGLFCNLGVTYRGGFRDNSFYGQGQQLGEDYHFKGWYENNLKKKGTFSWSVHQRKSKANVSVENKLIEGLQGKNGNKDMTEIQSNVPEVRDFENIPLYNYTYQGELDVHQLFRGKGTLKDPQGTYVGQFERGKKHGKGQYLFESELKYVGEYQNDERNGQGTLFNCDGTVAYEGQWRNGLPNGNGFSYDLQGNRNQGLFVEGLNSNILA